MAPTLTLKGLLLPLIWATLAAARAVSWYDDRYSFLGTRQEDELSDEFCDAPCDIGGCIADACSTSPFLTVRSPNSWAQTNASAHWLGKRAFSNEHPSTYIPAVFHRTASDLAYFGTPKDFQGRSKVGRTIKDTEQPVSWQYEFKDRPFQLVSGGLHGCTMVTLVSKRAVWMAHYWESYSNGPWVATRPADDHNDKVWIERVVMHFKGQPVTKPTPSMYRSKVTGTDYIKPGPSAVGIDPNLFNRDDDDTKLFIMSPVAEGKPAGGDLRYPKKMDEIRRQIRSHLGFGAKDYGKIPAVTMAYLRLNYKKPEEKALENKTQRGMALFQYDPQGEGGKAWRLYYEDTCYHSSTPNNKC
ncbi:hypothetical protein C8A03DRAFT_35518 [Achaetomium macrosporum]|uniref:Uncharacterized protein n=1 Tax=Achaetomium macrosporum TaxID=79813 RepID=A0AAN7C747_9PEZI|nr:hypothetical protein C8A03DRAFT_35518 [Achaetomium macrosporum]